MPIALSSSSVRTVQEILHVIVPNNNVVQNSSDDIRSYPPDSHHCTLVLSVGEGVLT